MRSAAPTVPKGLLIAAPHSGAGKTTVTLALLRALKNRGCAVASAKSGPDYIDPKFHEAACGTPCANLDAFAMSGQQLRHLAGVQAENAQLLIVEGAMGLFDGAANGTGSAADLAACLGVPVVLVVDCARQSQSVAALVSGFANFRPDVKVAGLVLNRVGSARHEAMLRKALLPLNIPVVGALPRDEALHLPDRHLGLVQASEHGDLERFLETAAERVRECLDLDLLDKLATPLALAGRAEPKLLLPPPAQRIAIARDQAFAFCYPHLLDDWRRAGAALSFFSPLADEAPEENAESVYLPGGYPELYAGPLVSAETFRSGMMAAAERGALIYGECGGYMTLGEALIDADGGSHPMLGLLPLVTSFAARKRHLGYRVLTPLNLDVWPGLAGKPLMGHEFHYASIISEGPAERLFSATDAEGTAMPDMGLRCGRVMGSFAHVICQGV
ncbi:cobyrinate a,c-diamide synthase [Roseibium sp.]|uniref:cobyrinate a,c-diamide synthase n=1 Tax=Roseibium sp. TaxID=1936156 RepID=UPI003A974E0E